MKPVILTFARYYLPGFRAGGPIRTIANMVERLGDSFEFRIVTLDHDLGDDCPYPGIESNSWIPKGDAQVRYVSAKQLGLREIAEIAKSTPHDIIYLNSFFDPRFTQQVLANNRMGRLSGRPIVIASRGEFSVGALRIKWWKKKVFIKLAKWLKLYHGLTWQASSIHEAEDIERSLSIEKKMAGRLVVSGHVTAAPNPFDAKSSAGSAGASVSLRLNGPLRVCFLSRISEMKNIDFALRVLAEVRVPVRFAVYGPIEDANYWARCEALISRLPPNIQVVYEGPVSHELVAQALAQHDLFLFPTRGENFGHVIQEALRAGLTLLISDQTPWRQLEARGVGWDLPLLDVSAFARRIEDVSRWSVAERQQSAARAHALSVEVADDQETLEANRRLFLDLIGIAKPS